MKSEAMMFAEFASIKALEDAKWDPNSIRDRLRTGVCLGNSMVDLDYISVCHDLVNRYGCGTNVFMYLDT